MILWFYKFLILKLQILRRTDAIIRICVALMVRLRRLALQRLFALIRRSFAYTPNSGKMPRLLLLAEMSMCLEREWRSWIANKGQPENPGTAFAAFCRKK